MDKQAKRKKRLALLQEINSLEQAHKESTCEIKDVYKCVDEKCAIALKIQMIGVKLSDLKAIANAETKQVKRTYKHFPISKGEYVRLKQQSKLDKEIANEIGVTKIQLDSWKRYHKITSKVWNGEEIKEKQFKERFNIYLKLKTEGLSDVETAKKMGISLSTFRTWKKKHNVKKKVAKLYEYYR